MNIKRWPKREGEKKAKKRDGDWHTLRALRIAMMPVSVRMLPETSNTSSVRCFSSTGMSN